jgi:hypothetical protein
MPRLHVGAFLVYPMVVLGGNHQASQARFAQYIDCFQTLAYRESGSWTRDETCNYDSYVRGDWTDPCYCSESTDIALGT